MIIDRSKTSEYEVWINLDNKDQAIVKHCLQITRIRSSPSSCSQRSNDDPTYRWEVKEHITRVNEIK